MTDRAVSKGNTIFNQANFYTAIVAVGTFIVFNIIGVLGGGEFLAIMNPLYFLFSAVTGVSSEVFLVMSLIFLVLFHAFLWSKMKGWFTRGFFIAYFYFQPFIIFLALNYQYKWF